MKNWQLQQAKASLSEVVQFARTRGPQRISLRGKPAAVVISAEDYNKLHKPKPGFVEFIRRSPLMGLKLKFEREQTPTREVDL